jgi:hypothetical protein
MTTMTTTKTKTLISNSFTGYSATIRTKSQMPAVSTIRKHLRAAKASDCQSTTTIFIDGAGYELVHGELVHNGRYPRIAQP